MKCRRMIKDDKGQNYVVWFGAKQPKGTTNNNVRVLEFNETVELDGWHFDVYTQNLSNEVKIDLTEGQEVLSKEVDFWIPLEQTILSQSDVSFECQILDDTPRTANFMNVDISALPLTIDNLTPLEGSTIQLDTIKGRSVKWTQLVDKSNLYSISQEISGVTFATNKTNGTITVNGTATADIKVSVLGIGESLYMMPKTYICLKGCPGGGSDSTYYLRWANYDIHDIGNGIYRQITSLTDTTLVYVNLEIIIKSGTTMSNKVFRPQFFNVSDIYGLGKEPATITDFNKDYPYSIYPYGKQEILTTKVSGIKIRAGYKNIFNVFANTTTINGVTFTNNGDGSIIVNGTATDDIEQRIANGWHFMNVDRNNFKCLLKGCPTGGSTSTYSLKNGWNIAYDYGNGNISLLTSVINKYINIPAVVIIKQGTVCNNLVFKPQLINLTDTYGIGNEPKTVAQFQADFPNIDDIPYPEQTISFAEQTLYGINDAQDTLQVVKENNGYKLQRVENIIPLDLGVDVRWHKTEGSKVFDSYIIDKIVPFSFTSLPNMITTNYIADSRTNFNEKNYNKTITSTNRYMFIIDNSYETVDTLTEALKGQVCYVQANTPTTTTIATLTKSQVTALFAKGYCVEILGNDDNKVIVRPDLSLIFNEFEAPFGGGSAYFGLGNKELGWVDEDNLEASLDISNLQTFSQSNTEYDISHLRLQFLDGNFQISSSTPIIRFKISSKNKMNWYNEDDKHDNYAQTQEGVATSLTQRLSVLKNELWYDYNYGVPLFDKVKSKAFIDSYLISTILKHPDVTQLIDFTSNVDKNSYSCTFKVKTKYGDLTVNL